MTQPVGPSRSEWLQNLVGPPPLLPPPPAAPPPREASTLPDPAAGTPGQGTVRLTPHVASAGGAEQVPSAVVAARLDAFIVRATPTFRTDAGWVSVPIAFKMAQKGVPSEATRDILKSVVRRAGISGPQVDLLNSGRATPELIARATQVLIDDGYLPALTSGGSDRPADRIRQLMFDFGLGLDCAGYVAPASLAARGAGRSAARFAEPLYESLSNLHGQGYVQLHLLDHLRPGDIFVLGPNKAGEVGHRAIVREAQPASSSEIAEIRSGWLLPNEAAASDRWLKIVVDSSWGSGGNPQRGGVERRTWWYETTSGLWAWRSGGMSVLTTGPYDHRDWSVYTPPGAR